MALRFAGEEGITNEEPHTGVGSASPGGVSAYPYAIALWVRQNSFVNADNTLFDIEYNTLFPSFYGLADIGGYDYLNFEGEGLLAHYWDDYLAVGPDGAYLQIKCPFGEWFHVLILVEAPGSRTVYVNGEVGVLVTNQPTAANPLHGGANGAEVWVGAGGVQCHADIAHFASWQLTSLLTDEEIAQLQASPPNVVRTEEVAFAYALDGTEPWESSIGPLPGLHRLLVGPALLPGGQGTGVDSLALLFSGGPSNNRASASLGGQPSSHYARARGYQFNKGLGTTPYVISGLEILDVRPGATGDVILTLNEGGIDFSGVEGENPGERVLLLEGETRILQSNDPNKAVTVRREAGLSWQQRTIYPTLLTPMNGLFGHGNLTDAQRSAGRTTYRALFLRGGAKGAIDIKIWFPPQAGQQCVLSVATEVLVAGAIQTVPNETTAPSGRAWVTPTDEAGALKISGVGVNSKLGLWIRRTFPPAGVVNPHENVHMALKYKGV